MSIGSRYGKPYSLLVALLLLSYRCLVTVNVLWLLLTVPLVGLQCVIVVFPDHTHLLYVIGSCFKRQHSEILKENRSHFIVTKQITVY